MHPLAPVAVLPRCDRGGVRLTPTEALQLSLRLDLVRLFNARNGLTIARFLGGGPTALDYGLPDTGALSPHSSADRECWERVITRAILLYEPRLRQVRVEVTQDAAQAATARVVICATAVGADEAGVFQFDFDVTLDQVMARVGA